jgi:Secretion system C-terminal sorting domain
LSVYPAQCVPATGLAAPSFSPTYSALPCAVQGSSYGVSFSFRNFNRIGTATVDSIIVDSIVNLPCGIGWRMNQASHRLTNRQTGCFDLCGITNDSAGQYELTIYVEVFSRTAIPGITGASLPLSTVGTAAGRDLRYWINVQTAIGPCATVDTTTGSAANLISSCNTGASTCGFTTPVFTVYNTVDSICYGDTSILTVDSAHSYSFQWYQNGALVTGAVDTVLYATSPGTYYVRARSLSSGTFYYSDTVTISLGSTCPPPPSFHVTMASDTFCIGDTDILQVNLLSGFGYQWYRARTALGGGSDTVFYATTSGIYYVQATEISSGTIYRSDSVHIYAVNCGPIPVPVLSGFTSGDTICAGDSVVLHVGSFAGYTYSWYRNGRNIRGITDSNLTVRTAGTYYVRVQLPGAPPTNYYSDTVTVYTKLCGATPVFTVTYSHDTICFGDTVILHSNGYPGATYRWFNLAGPAFGFPDTNYTAFGAGIYYMRATIGGINYYSDTVEIFNSTPDALRSCMASYDAAANKNKVVWSNEYNSLADSVIIYRNVGGTFNPIGSVSTSVDPVFFDPTPIGTGSATYQVTEKDKCGLEGTPSDNVSTVWVALTVDASGNRVLNWNAPAGFTPVRYHIYRGYSSTGLTLFDSVPASALGYTDRLPFVATFFYQVDAEMSSACVHTGTGTYDRSFSNIVATGGVGISSTTWDNTEVFPNPFSNALQVNVPTHPEAITYEIRNIQGAVLSSGMIPANTQHATISTANWAQGAYFLYMKTSGEQKVWKLICE